MTRLFSQVQVKKPKYNTFDLSHEKKLSFNPGDLVPIYLQEVLPGDKFKVNSEILIRMAPMVFPLMHRVNVYTHYFYVPNRLVWNSWEDFITGGEDGLQNPAFPKIAIWDGNKQLASIGCLSDFMGIPTTPSVGFAQGLEISALPFRAYQMIYNEYYRDQNLISEIAFSKGNTLDAGDDERLLQLRKRCWEKDYFTSALPWAQRGNEVTLPLQADLNTTDETTFAPLGGGSFDNGAAVTVEGGILKANKAAVKTTGLLNSADALGNVGTTINEMRRALRLQEWLERSARVGSRYIEQIWGHFFVKSSDARLQRPEYLGGGKNPIVISEVLNTSDTASAPQGSMSGHGISIGNQNTFIKGFEEHGHIIGIMSVLPRTAYQQGVDRSFLKFDKFDYYWPEFANLGEQAVESREVYYDYTAVNTDTFGYQPRYAEYKFKNSSVHGDFRDTYKDFHWGRIFASKPALNETFVKANPDNRIFAVEDANVDKLYCQIYNSVRAIRQMPVFGTPLL